LAAELGAKRGKLFGSQLSLPEFGKRYQRCRRVARAAADARGDRKNFFERDERARRSTELARQQFSGTPDQVLVRILLRQCGAEGTRDRNGKLACRSDRDAVANVGEGDQAVEQMVAVGAAADDVKIEIELRRSEQAQPPLTFDRTAPRPWSSLTSIVFASLASGLN
jgi:hypothetical protein